MHTMWCVGMTRKTMLKKIAMAMGLPVLLAAIFLCCTLLESSENSTNGDRSNDFWKSRSSDWVFPVQSNVLDIYSGSRYFGAPRNGGSRSHAGVDLVPTNGPGTSVVAMTSGTVVAYYEFYAGTYALEVKNSDGTIARYCEITSNLNVGATVARGEIIGKIVKNAADGAYMLHLEMYMNTTEGPLTDRNNTVYNYVPKRNYQRRSDLLDPMGVIVLQQ